MDLGTACADGLFESASGMLESGENPNQLTNDGYSPLCLAAFWGHTNIVKLLLSYGAEVNAANRGTLMTPLHAAAFQGRGKVILTLLEAAALVTTTDKYGRTPSYYASADDAIWPLFASKGCTRDHVRPMEQQFLFDQESESERVAYLDPLKSHHLAAGDVLGNTSANPELSPWEK